MKLAGPIVLLARSRFVDVKTVIAIVIPCRLIEGDIENHRDDRGRDYLVIFQVPSGICYN